MKVRSALPQWISPIPGILCFLLMLPAYTLPAGAAWQFGASDQQGAEQAESDEGLEPLPMSPVEKAQKDGTAVLLSLKDITRLALENNIDIAVEGTNERSSLENLKSAYASYDPTLSFTLGTNSSKSANTRLDTASQEGDFTTSKRLNWNINYSQQVRTGGNLRASWQTSRSSSNEAFSFYNPNWSTSASVTFTQPLWRNLLIDQNRGNLKIRKLDLENSNISFKRTVTSNISRIQQQYWDLVSAIRNYEIQRNSLRLSQRNLRDIRKKVEVGTLAPIEITQANYQVAQTRLRLINAEDTIHRQMNNMRQYISGDRNNQIWAKVIVPTDTPDFQEYRIDETTAIETAMKNRPELLQSDLDLEKSDINLRLARENRKWGVDLQASYGSQGASGTPGPNISAPPENIGGVGTAYDNLFTGGLTNWSLQVSLDIPLWDRSVDVGVANQLISRYRTVLQRRKQEQAIQVEIRNAVQSLETSRQQVETANLNMELAREQLDGEEKRFEAGLSEFYRVLDQQNRLAEAENGALSALITYKQAIITLQESMNTLLEQNHIEIAKSASSHIPDLR